jgi:hypothetical protein
MNLLRRSLTILRKIIHFIGDNLTVLRKAALPGNLPFAIATSPRRVDKYGRVPLNLFTKKFCIILQI